MAGLPDGAVAKEVCDVGPIITKSNRNCRYLCSVRTDRDGGNFVQQFDDQCRVFNPSITLTVAEDPVRVNIGSAIRIDASAMHAYPCIEQPTHGKRTGLQNHDL